MINSYLFITFHNSVIINDDHLARLFFQIERELRYKLYINNGLLVDYNNEEVRAHSVYTKDRNGEIRKHMTKVIKKLKAGRNVYEIRINEEYLKHRALFFPSEIEEDNLEAPNIIFTTGFTKSDGDEFIDPTTNLALATQDIYDQYKDSKVILKLLVI